MQDIVVAAPILARGEEDARRLYDAVESLSRHGLPVFLTDGGSDEGFVRRLAELPGVSVRPVEDGGPGRLVAQVQQALREAGKRDPRWVLYTEPDKRWFFEHRLTGFLTRAREDTAASSDVIVAARDAASFATFPPGQQTTERLLNHLFMEALGQQGDCVYGPLLIPADLLPYIEEIREDIGWGWRIFLLTVCCRLGRPLTFHTADLPCPPEQRGENDVRSRAYRLEQLAQNVRGLALGMKYPLPSP